MAAPTLVAFAQAEAASATAVAVTTASISYQTNDVVTVIVGTDGGGTETLNAPTTTGAGLTLTQRQIHQASSNCSGGVWNAVAASNSSGTFSTTTTFSGGGSRHHTIGVFVHRGSAGVGNTAIQFTATRTAPLTPVGADGAICWGVFDWAAAAVQAFSPTSTTHGVAAPGPVALPVNVLSGTAYTYYLGVLDDQTSAASASYGIGGSGTGPFTIVVAEAKAGAGGAVTPRRRATRRTVRRSLPPARGRYG